jgi:O-antigen/teichoic acid export membrane protein
VRLKLAWSAFGSLWTAAVQILVIPLYARLTPVEVYGVVLFTLAVRGSVLGVAHGFRVAFARSIATTGSAGAVPPGLQLGFVVTGASLSLGLLLLSPVLASRWLQMPAAHSVSTSVALAWLAASCACEWWATRWEAVLWGMQRIRALAVMRVAAATSLGLGGAAVLHWRPRSAAPFCAFQALMAGVYLLVVWRLARLGGVADRHRPQTPTLAALAAPAGELAASVVLPSMAALALLADRTLISGMLPIGTYAAYGAAAAAASGLLVVAAPVVETLYPKLAGAYARGAVEEAVQLVLRGAQWVALVAIPATAVLSLESGPVLSLWLGTGRLASEGATALRWLAPAFALIGLASLGTSALVAAGAARRGLAIQAAHLPIACATLAAAAHAGGIELAAFAWALSALMYCLATAVAVTRLGRWEVSTRRMLVRTAVALLLAPPAAMGAVLSIGALSGTGSLAVMLRLVTQGVAALLTTALVLALLTGRPLRQRSARRSTRPD